MRVATIMIIALLWTGTSHAEPPPSDGTQKAPGNGTEKATGNGTEKATGNSTDNECDVALPDDQIQAEMKKALKEAGVTVSDPVTEHYVETGAFGGDKVVLFVNGRGNPYFPMPDTIDEHDKVFVAIIDQAGCLEKQLVELKIESCEAVPLDVRVMGGFVSGNEDDKKKGKVVPAHKLVPIGRCAGSTDKDSWPKVKLKDPAVFSYRVNPIYTLAIGIGLGYDNTTRRDLTARVRPGDTVPTIAEENDQIGLTSFASISWFPFGRDFRKRDFFMLERSQLFAGVDLARIDESLILGVGYELFMGLNLQAGWRVLTRNEILAEGSGLNVGDTFDPTRGDLPTRDRWEVGSFIVGVSASDDLLRAIGARD